MTILAYFVVTDTLVFKYTCENYDEVLYYFAVLSYKGAKVNCTWLTNLFTIWYKNLILLRKYYIILSLSNASLRWERWKRRSTGLKRKPTGLKPFLDIHCFDISLSSIFCGVHVTKSTLTELPFDLQSVANKDFRVCDTFRRRLLLFLELGELDLCSFIWQEQYS